MHRIQIGINLIQTQREREIGNEKSTPKVLDVDRSITPHTRHSWICTLRDAHKTLIDLFISYYPLQNTLWNAIAFFMGGVFSLRRFQLRLLMPSNIAMGWIRQPASVHLYHFKLTWNLNQKSPHSRRFAFGRNLTFSVFINGKAKPL